MAMHGDAPEVVAVVSGADEVCTEPQHTVSVAEGAHRRRCSTGSAVTPRRDVTAVVE